MAGPDHFQLGLRPSKTWMPGSSPGKAILYCGLRHAESRPLPTVFPAVPESPALEARGGGYSTGTKIEWRILPSTC